ncbi:gliding motility-associated C-terminal domain-containing protein [Prevotella sp. 10(H)]|uniref:T9SS type B sorting domain-containing protein n=1 Tax=Prevotella sp. 10(H) TaxID=1158294 RepID=UPI0006915222|nr:gliding motility-associated C-terminal domain-containing protein [Prevotella sp. 10(H)]
MKKIFFLLFTVVFSVQLFSQDAEEDLVAHIDYEAERRDALNETITQDEINNKIFSAPVLFSFYGSGGKDAVFYTWFIYKKEDQNNPIARYSDKDMKYTFEQMGEYVVKLEVADKDANTVEDTFSFRVTDSYLDIPNYFSPGDSPGVNDEFRVAYKSITKFKCTIFNRWGQKLYEWSDPAKGWDGKYKGKYVNTGVYYYVIEALGADGVRYKRGGDINILRSR